MGLQRGIHRERRFFLLLYYQDGETIVASNGVEGKVVVKIDGSSHDGLPIYSNTSEVYFKRKQEW